MNDDQDNLFRSEALESKRARLDGKVIVKQTISSVALACILVTVIAIAALWISLGEYARTEQVRGILRTTEPSSIVSAARAGIVSKFQVTEGQFVEQGDQIVVVDLDSKSEDGIGSSETSLETISNRLSLADKQISVSKRLTQANQKELSSIVSNADRQLDSIESQLGFQREIVVSNQSLFDKVAALVERGFVSQIDYESRKQTLLDSQQALSRLNQQKIGLQAERSKALAELAKSEFNASLERLDIGVAIESLSQQRAQFLSEKSYVITAPISGRVTAIQVAQGKTVQPNVPLLTIIPEESDLEAVLYAPTRAVGFVKKGQETRLLFDAFPYQRFGSFDARISEVSRTVIDPRNVDAPFELEEPVYKVKARLDRQVVSAFGEQISLQPGMTLSGNIILERRSFLDWLMTPLNAVANRN